MLAWYASHLNIQLKYEYYNEGDDKREIIEKIEYPLKQKLIFSVMDRSHFSPSDLLVSLQITKIHCIPFYIRKLTLCGIGIHKIPNILPCMLEELSCIVTSLPCLPETMPAGLLKLCCRDNNFAFLPEILPDKLIEIDCRNNKLTRLPEKLPPTLKKIYCINNNLTTLPKLPSTLELLICHSNPITELPDIPSSVIELGCESCNLKYLPDLPYCISKLSIALNPELHMHYPLLIIAIYNIGVSYETRQTYKYERGILGAVMYINDCNSRRRTQERTRKFASELADRHYRRALHPNKLAPLLDNPDIDPNDFMDHLGDSI